MRYAYLLLILCTSLLACNKNDTSRPSSADYFPNSVGNYWKYKYVDSISNVSVFVNVSIVGNTILPGGQNASIWTYTFPNHIDTNFVYQKGDTIRILDKGFSIRYTYIIPFTLNGQWRTNPYYVYDSIKVADNRTFSLNNQDFENSFLLHQAGHLPNDHWEKLEWFCPNIGVVTRSEKDALTITNDFTNTYWELVTYNLR